MTPPTVAAPPRAPGPPSGFRGSFFSDAARLEAAAEVSGPIHIVPAAIALPAHADDVAVLVAWASREGVPLVPRGAGTGMPGGNVGGGVLLDLSRLSDLRTPSQGDDTVAVGAGVNGAAVDRAARAVGRFFPALPSSADRCTVGGMVANNAAGVRSFGHGAMRSWVEALDVVLADGTQVTLERGRAEARFTALRSETLTQLGASGLAWPRVRKNSSGYALDRFLPGGDPVELMVGSEGTLGVVTGARLRLAPLPAERALVALPLGELAALDHVAAEARRMRASACEFFGPGFLELAGLRTSPPFSDILGGARALALVEVEGDREALEERLGAIHALARSLGARPEIARTGAAMDRLWEVRHAASPVIAARAKRGSVSIQFIEDSVVPDGAVARYLEGLDALLRAEGTEAVVFGHAGDGNVHVNPLVDIHSPGWRDRVRRILEATVDLVASLGGTLAGEHGDGRIRAPFHDRIFGPAAAHAFTVVKRRLDPSAILNPGVVVPLEGQDPLIGLTPRRRRA